MAEILWTLILEELNIKDSSIIEALSYIKILPVEALELLDPHIIFDKISMVYQTEGEKKLVLINLSPQNMEKVSVCLAKLSQVVYSYEKPPVTNGEDTSPKSIIETYESLCDQLVKSKIKSLQKNKGKFRISASEIESLGIIINDVLSEESETLPEYLELYKLAIKHFVSHFQSYSVNEDVQEIIKILYTNNSRYFSQARQEWKETMQQISGQILSEHVKVIKSWFKPKLGRSITVPLDDLIKQKSNEESKKEDEKQEEKEELMYQFDQNELFELIDNVFEYPAGTELEQDMLVQKIEYQIGKELDRLTPGSIFSILNKIYQKQEYVSFELLSKLESQFLKGKITDLSPPQITNLMKIYHSSQCSKPFLPQK